MSCRRVVLTSLMGWLVCTVPAWAEGADTNAAGVEVLYERHVAPLLSRLGCNGGLCHGAVQGKGGLRLSLFGVDPQGDYQRLLQDFGGRRVNLQHPESSLLLLKPTGQVPHQGGVRMAVGSRHYEIFRTWIARGASRSDPARSRLTSLEITPAIYNGSPGEAYRLVVRASFADGSSEDVTDLCTFESSDPVAAEVDAAGQVRLRRPGAVALLVRYGGEPAVARVFVRQNLTRPFPEVQPHNFVDEHILKQLRLLNIPPAELCDDVTFLRRVSLDVTGALPSPEEIRAFLADSSPDKRSKKIEELLARPGYSALWATKFCDWLRPRISYSSFERRPSPQAVRRFYDWIRARLEENIPYDELAARILLATSLDGRTKDEWIEEVQRMWQEESDGRKPWTVYRSRKTLDLYWHRYDATGVKGAIQVAHAFLGLRLQCAECHRHPTDIWTQDDLLSFANFFQRLRANTGVLTVDGEKRVYAAVGSFLTEQDKAKIIERHGKDANKVKNFIKFLETSAVYPVKGNPFGWATVTSSLGTSTSRRFRLLGEREEVQVADDQDPREIVVNWLRRPDNPYFARAIVNRIWAHYFGRGLVEPADHLSRLNPPTHPELLDELCRQFVAHKYDLKWLHRVILNSRTYQQSSCPHPDNPGADGTYAAFYPRRLAAEIVLDAINHATGATELMGNGPAASFPPGTRILEIPGRFADGIVTNVLVEHLFTVFGRPLRSSENLCDCERDNQVNLEQVLFLANHPDLLNKIYDPKKRGSRIMQIVKQHQEPVRQVEELYLWTMARLPTQAELQICLDYMKQASSPERALQDILWGLINSKAFLLNY